MDQNCNAHGKCTCKENVIGDKCDTVVEAFYDITDPKGTYTNVAIICPIKDLSCNSRVINEFRLFIYLHLIHFDNKKFDVFPQLTNLLLISIFLNFQANVT